MPTIDLSIARELGIPVKRIENTLRLLNEGATIPFISRYRKEATGGLDEVQIAQIGELKEKYEDLEKRKKYILKSIQEQGKLTLELKNRINECKDRPLLEDLYLPFKPKRMTRAEKAR